MILLSVMSGYLILLSMIRGYLMLLFMITDTMIFMSTDPMRKNGYCCYYSHLLAVSFDVTIFAFVFAIGITVFVAVILLLLLRFFGCLILLL